MLVKKDNFNLKYSKFSIILEFTLIFNLDFKISLNAK